MKSNKRKGWVGLLGLQLQGSIGVYDREKHNGTTLELDVWIFGDLKPAISSDQLEKSLNYELLEIIVQEAVQKGNHLLEPVANKILEQILVEMPLVEKARIELKKLNPSLRNPCNASAIRLSLKRQKK